MSDVSEAMVKPAGDVLMQHGLNAPEQVIYQAARGALTAALAARPKVRVKALEWVPFGSGMFTAKAPPIGTYAVEDGYLPLKLNGHTIGRYESVAEAKAAAQADYEARVLAALEEQP